MKPRQPFDDAGSNASEDPGLTELQWTAFRYLSDELTPRLAAEFEGELADNPAAREALDQVLCVVTELEASGVPAANSLPRIEVSLEPARSVPRKSGWDESRRTIRWLAAVATAGLVLLGIARLTPIARQARQQGGLEQGRLEPSLDSEMLAEVLAEIWASSLSDESADTGEEADDEGLPGDEWLYSALVSLESPENWPSEDQGGS